MPLVLKRRSCDETSARIALEATRMCDGKIMEKFGVAVLLGFSFGS